MMKQHIKKEGDRMKKWITVIVLILFLGLGQEIYATNVLYEIDAPVLKVVVIDVPYSFIFIFYTYLTLGWILSMGVLIWIKIHKNYRQKN